MIYVEKWQRRDLLVKIILFCDISMPNCSVLAIRNENRFVHVKLNRAESSCVFVTYGIHALARNEDYAKAINSAGKFVTPFKLVRRQTLD